MLALHLASGPSPSPSPSAPTPATVTAPRTLWALTGFSLALLLFFLAAAAVDSRSFQGANVWMKPAKFALSFTVLYATLAWVVERLSVPVREGRLMRFTLAAMVLATWTELAYIAGRAGMAQASHFAVDTPVLALLYALMGVGAVTLVIGIAVIGVLAGRDRHAALGPGLQAGVRWGFLLSAAATLITAGFLSSQGSHFVGTPSAGAAVIPGLGWSAEVGDLRPAHFLALHAMQALPLLGAWLDHRRRGGPGVLRWAALAYAVLTAAVFIQALMGQPLLRG